MILDQADFEHLLELRSGAAKLDALAEAHLQEIAHLAPTMRTLWRALEHAADGDTPHPAARQPNLASAG